MGKIPGPFENFPGHPKRSIQHTAHALVNLLYMASSTANTLAVPRCIT